MLSPSLLPSPSPSSACRHAKPLQSCLTLCDLICSPLGSSVHEILQAAILEWVAKPSSRESSQPRDRTHISYISCIGRWVLYHQSLCHIRVSCSKWDMTQVSAPPVMGATDTPLALPQGAGMGAPQLGAPPAEWASQATPLVQPISAPRSFHCSLSSQGVQSLKQPAWAPLHLPAEGDPTKVSSAPTPHTTHCTTSSVRAGRDQAPPSKLCPQWHLVTVGTRVSGAGPRWEQSSGGRFPPPPPPRVTLPAARCLHLLPA